MKSNQPLHSGNDSLRTRGKGGKVVITPAVFRLGMNAVMSAISLIKHYDTIEKNQSSGKVTFDGKEIFWKIETLTISSRKEKNTSITAHERALIIFLKCDNK